MWNRLPLIAGALGYTFFVRPQLLKWGTRLGESQRLLPGDDIIPQPNFQITAAANIDAPPEAVWLWLAQMGRERTGYYGLDLLTNEAIPSVTFVRQDVAPAEVDMPMDGGYRIITLEPERALVFGGFSLQRQPLGVIQDFTALYLLEHRQDGSTRLLVRQRGFSYGVLGMLFNLMLEPVCFLFVTQQLDQIKRYAERMAHLKA
ncbi:MAG: hypothetical protein K8S97_05045 [Anaerolineae bacterium]|nr:hypothetical protein [Anaerolineae bacterium]